MADLGVSLASSAQNELFVLPHLRLEMPTALLLFIYITEMSVLLS